MGRKRIELGSAVDAEIEARTARGESAQTIFEAIGRKISIETIKRRQRDLRRGTSPAPIVQLAVEDVPENPPENTPIEDLNRWIARLEAGASKAEEQGNLAALASIAAKVAALMNLRHRQAPLPKTDPNELPDMKALAVTGRERLRKLANALFTPRT